MLPSITIGIPTHNRVALTLRAIRSVIAQDYCGEITVGVFDDGTDMPDAAALMDAVLDLGGIPGRKVQYGRDGTNRGIAHAKNVALEMGVGELRGILDSDDELLPNHVSRCVAALMKHPDIDVVYTDDIDHNDATGAHAITPAADWNDGEALLNCALRGDTWLARWSALQRSGLHDERFALEVDYDLFHALWRSGAKFLHVPGASVIIHRHDGHATKDRSKAAYWHAACLAKYGHGIEWALRRAASHGEWLPAIREGYAAGLAMKKQPLTPVNRSF